MEYTTVNLCSVRDILWSDYNHLNLDAIDDNMILDFIDGLDSETRMLGAERAADLFADLLANSEIDMEE